MATRTARKAPEPFEVIAGTPVYRPGQAPAHLYTRRQLAKIRRKPKPAQRPAAYLYMRVPGGPGSIYADLFQLRGCAHMRPLTPAETARRTCPTCGQVGPRDVNGERCGACWRKTETVRLREQDRERRRTCAGYWRYKCSAKRARPVPSGKTWYCRSCAPKVAAAQARAEEAARERRREAERVRRSCPDCQQPTATAKTIREWRAEHPGRSWRPQHCAPCLAVLYARLTTCPDECGTQTATVADVEAWAAEHDDNPTWFRRRTCESCQAKRDAEYEEHRREWAEQARIEGERREAELAAERERRRAEVAALSQWARDVLADPTAVILDTETTGLADPARIVEITVITAVTGETLLDTLINPGEPIPPEATAIHGITDAMVADAPSFADIADELADILADQRVLIWNAEFDTARIRYELKSRHLNQAAAVAGMPDGAAVPPGELRNQLTAEAFAHAREWLANVATECAMIKYSDWFGEWDDYWGNYTYQKLRGDHRSRGDCLKVRVRVAEMRDSGESLIPAPAEPTDDQAPTPAGTVEAER